MTKTATIVIMMAALALGAARHANAQIQPAPLTRGFVNVNIADQPQSRSFDTSSSFPIYDETATTTAGHRVRGGPAFDLSGGYRLHHRYFQRFHGNLAVGAGFTSFGDKHDSTIVASIPSPVFFGQSVSVPVSVSNLKHSERAFYLQAVYFMPVTTKVDVAFALGPTFVHARQEVLTTVTVPDRTQNVNPIRESQSKTGAGINIGLDGTYLFRPRYGAGLFLRYSGASVNLPAVDNLKVGGFQVGVGARVRF